MIILFFRADEPSSQHRYRKLDMGEFGNIYFIDFDQTRARKRTVQIQEIGE